MTFFFLTKKQHLTDLDYRRLAGGKLHSQQIFYAELVV